MKMHGPKKIDQNSFIYPETFLEWSALHGKSENDRTESNLNLD